MDNESQLIEIINKYRNEKNALIPLLQDVSRLYNYLPKEALKKIAEELSIPLTQVYSVVTFYKAFSLKPRGKQHICVCMGTACHVRGAPKILEKFEQELKIKAGETTPNMEYTLDTVNCLGACALGPLVTIDDQYHGKMTNTNVEKVLKK